MNYLVTGGAGFIGSNLVSRLLDDKDNTVHVVDNFFTGNKKNHHKNLFYDKRDVRDSLDDLNGFDVIFHLAALARIQPSFKNPSETIDVNVAGTANVCNLARRIDAKVVYAGSSSFYAGPYLNPYAFSKWQGEEICKMFSEVYGLSTANARFFNVYGNGQPSEGPYATIVGIFENQFKAKDALTITGDGNQRRDFTHVNDIVAGLMLMSEKKWSGEIFNLGTGKNHSINELAAMFSCETKFIEKRPGEARETLADISFSRNSLGYNPSVKIENYIKNWLDSQ